MSKCCEHREDASNRFGYPCTVHCLRRIADDEKLCWQHDPERKAKKQNEIYLIERKAAAYDRLMLPLRQLLNDGQFDSLSCVREIRAILEDRENA